MKYSCLLLSTVYCLLSTALFSQQWHKVKGWTGSGEVTTLKIIDSELYVGGGMAGLPPGAVKFNGNTWDSLGFGLAGKPNSLEKYNNEIYAGGNFTYAYSGQSWPNPTYIPNTSYFAKWNGGPTWIAVDSPAPNHNLTSLKYNGDLYIGGDAAFSSVGGISCQSIVRYNGTNWNNMQGGIIGPFPEVWSMAEYNGDLYVGGEFNKAGSIITKNIARWDGTKWDSVGGGLNGRVLALVVDTVNNVLYAGGEFTLSGSIQVFRVAKWDGNKWYSVGNIPSIGVGALTMFNNELYAGGGDYPPRDSVIYHWDGNKWDVIYGPGGGGVTSFSVYKGNLYVGGYFNVIDTTVVNCLACYGDSCPGTPIAITLPYGVKELNKQGLKFKVFPNPAKKEINIQVIEDRGQGTNNEKYIARIKNSLGQNIYEKKFEKELNINTSDFKKGIHFVEVCNSQDNHCHTEKVIIQ